jgi:nucleotide-binding universal stress UspA family protein
MIKKILLSIGGTPYTTVAIERAVQLAKRFDAEITGVIVISPDRPKNVGVAQKPTVPVNDRIVVTKERIEQAVSAFESACAAEGIRHDVKQKEKQTANQLISLSRYHDLMIFGLRAIFEYDISSEQPEDTLARLLSAGMGPIIAVSDKIRSIGKVLIAYDGSMESAKTMKRFVQLRLWSDAMLKIVTFHKSEDKARQLLYDASEYCRAHGFHVEREYNPGLPKNLLISMAHLWQADMIVLASTEQSMLMKLILRETTLHIIRDADIPLFLGR